MIASVCERKPDGTDGPTMVTGEGATVYNAIRKLLKNHEHVLPAQSRVRLAIHDGENEVLFAFGDNVESAATEAFAMQRKAAQGRGR